MKTSFTAVILWVGIVLLVFSVSPPVYSDELIITKDDWIGIKNLSDSLVEWRYSNELKPNQIAELVKALTKMEIYASRISNETLIKIDDEFAPHYRNEFHKGVLEYRNGLLLMAKNKGDLNSRKMADNGRLLILKFHRFYNKFAYKLADRLKHLSSNH